MTLAVAQEAVLPRRGRIAAIDVARGAALVGMFVYHLVWDLAYFGLVDDALPTTLPLRLFSHAVATTFLLLVGFSLVLATRDRIVWPATLERLVWIAAAAAGVSLATWFLFPSGFIFFGILHCIFVASILALAFVRLPVWATLLAAAACLAVPFAASPSLGAPALLWLGLGPPPPPTFDYRPLFPWAGVVLTGVAIARAALPRSAGAAWTRWAPRRVTGRVVAWAGRHSLIIYLMHQPVFIGGVFLLALASGEPSQADLHPFVRSCQRQCRVNGAAPDICKAACGCIVQRAKTEGLWPKVLDNSMSADERERFQHFGGDCLRSLPPPAPPRR